MGPNFFQTVNPDLAQQQLALSRQQALAQALMQQGTQPINPMRTAGRFVVPISMTEGIEKALQPIAGALMQKGIDTKQLELGKQQAAMVRALFNQPSQTQTGQAALAQGASVGDVGPTVGNAVRQQDITTATRNPLLPQGMDPNQAMQFAMGAGILPESYMKVLEAQNKPETFGTQVYWTKEGRPYQVGQKGTIKWADQNVSQPLTGFAQQLQQLSSELPPGMASNPNVQNAASGYIASQTGQYTPVSAGQQAVAQGRLANLGQQTQFETGTGYGTPQGPQPFNLYQGALPSMAPQPQPQVQPQPQPQGQQPQAQPQGQPSQQPRQGMTVNRPDLTPKQQVSLRETQPHDFASLQNSLVQMDRIIKQAEALANHPQLPRATGAMFLGGYVPYIGSNFKEQLESLKSQVMLGALETLKQASKTGSAGFGQLSNYEGDTLRNSIASLDRAQTPDAMRAALHEVANAMRASSQRLISGYQNIYGSAPQIAQPQQSPQGRVVDFSSLR